MAKLADGRDWLERTLGDNGRAHSLIVKGRDQGIFTKGKRGGSAPELKPADFATLIACALTTAAPSQIGAAVERIFGLSLWSIDYDLYDGAGWQNHLNPNRLSRVALNLLEAFELGFSGSNSSEATFGWALITLIISRTQNVGFGLTDRIELVEQGSFMSANILLHKVGIGDRPGNSKLENSKNRSIRLTFSDLQEGDLAQVESRRGLYCSSLNKIALMSKLKGDESG